MTTATVIQATVKYPSREPKDYGYGLKVNVVLTASNGEEIKLWGKPDEAIATLKKGQSVQLVHDGKKYKLLENATSKAEISAVEAEIWSDDKKRAIAQTISQNADLLAYCLQTSKVKFMETGLISSEESMRTLATTLFIQASKSS
jgi:hypothetical protein